MANLSSNENCGRKTRGVQKIRKAETRVDLTPMVDLGFLLITFFIFTTSMTEPKAMALYLPDDTEKKEPTPVKESGALTILLCGVNSWYYYEGKLNTVHSNVTKSSLNNIRNIIINKKQRTSKDDLFVTIKAGNDCVYKDIVNTLDEMTINDINRYAFVDISLEEQDLIEDE
jgi:biopolymer transport protein ExbD